MTASGDYRALARRMQTLPERIVRAGATEMQDSVLATLKRDSGGDMMLSGTVRRRGRRIRLGVSTKVSPGTRLATATVEASPKRTLGVWSWLEHGTQAHLVGRPRGAMTRGLHMKIGSQWATGPWRVGGSPAKHTFTDGVTFGTSPAERAMGDVWERSL